MPEVLLTDAGRDQLAYLDDDASTAPTWVGASGSGWHEFRAPRAIARLGSAFLIADSGNHRIVVIDDPIGGGWQSFGSHGSGPGEFDQPTGVAVDSQSRIYVADTGNRRVVRLDGIDGSGWIAFGVGGSPTPTDPAIGRFRRPAALAVDGTDALWIADWECSRIARVTSMSGAGWSTFGVDAPVALAADDDNAAILVAALGEKRIGRHDAATGTPTAATPTGALTAPAAVQLHDATVFALDAAARRLLTIDDTLSQVTTRNHLADLDVRRPTGMVVW